MKKKNLRRILTASHLAFAFFGLYTFLYDYQLSENLLVQKTLNKQITLAKAGSSAVENLLKNIQHQLSSLVFSFVKVNGSPTIDLNTTRAFFSSYVNSSQQPISSIALYDEKGLLTILENREHVQTGENQDFSNAEFIKWSKNPANKDKTFVSTPYRGTVGTSVGKIILVVAKPVYLGNTYKGTLAVRLRFDSFAKAFITPLMVDTNEDTFIIDANGVVIAGRDTLLNSNLFTYANGLKWDKSDDFTNKLTMMVKTDTFQTTWNFQNPSEKPKVLLVGSSKIDIPGTDKDLYMVVTSSKEGIISSLSALRNYGLAWIGLGIVTTIITTIILMVI